MPKGPIIRALNSWSRIQCNVQCAIGDINIRWPTSLRAKDTFAIKMTLVRNCACLQLETKNPDTSIRSADTGNSLSVTSWRLSDVMERKVRSSLWGGSPDQPFFFCHQLNNFCTDHYWWEIFCAHKLQKQIKTQIDIDTPKITGNWTDSWSGQWWQKWVLRSKKPLGVQMLGHWAGW